MSNAAAGTKRQRGLAIHRSILIGSTSTPLTALEKMSAPPDHTHRWTVAVRSAASWPLPSVVPFAGGGGGDAGTSATASASTTHHGRSRSVRASVDLSTAASGDGNAASAPHAQAQAQGQVGTPTGTATPLATPSQTPGPSTLANTVSTRAREAAESQNHDYHRMVGGKDDISHFVKKVTFKLHETYAGASRTVDKPPFQVTETGWGEFDIQIRIVFVPEANEKPLTTYHRLKLHPWHPIEKPVTVTEADHTVDGDSDRGEGDAGHAGNAADAGDAGNAGNAGNAGDAAEDEKEAQEATQQPGDTSTSSATAATHAHTENPAAPPLLPPVVHSWQYDEIVFPEPTEIFYDILIKRPQSSLFPTSAQAFSDPTAYRSYQSLLSNIPPDLSAGVGTGLASDVSRHFVPLDGAPTSVADGALVLGEAASGDPTSDQANASSSESHTRKVLPLPPHPLHAPSGALFDALSTEAINNEAQRLDLARICAVRELEEYRKRLIDGERKLRDVRRRLAS
ncbi:Transcription initiation factor IIF, auxiliary subunit [Ceraceosorus bombacis]|uniref:Transcription initiation factor IIF, auxiliary subunit n=1 Tax=Ceraceosorus bombacis TaxID=401625 RepID=A0A0P1BAX8_9BASI|nr:Transcription initiation factor IIF, auxiliary subunit [Ceraceosorus bombacis]